MNASELFGILLNLFGKVNPKVVVKTSFSPDQERLLELLIKKNKKQHNAYTIVLLAKTYLKILSDGDTVAYQRSLMATAKSSLLPPVLRENILKKVSDLSFGIASPPGPARLARVPFYPLHAEDAWSSRFLNIDTATQSVQAFGIDSVGDDPVLAIGPWLASSNSTKAGPYTMVTRKVEYGAYRVIGLEISAHYGSRYLGAIGVDEAAAGSVTNNGPAAVGMIALFTLLDPVSPDPPIATRAGINVRVQGLDSDGTIQSDVTYVSVAGAPVGAQFGPCSGPGVTPSDVADVLAAKINTQAGVTAIVVGRAVTVTQSNPGLFVDGAGTTTGGVAITTPIASSSDEVDPGGVEAPALGIFSGGTNNVGNGQAITVTDAAGASSALVATLDTAPGPGTLLFTIDQATPTQTMSNFRTAVNVVMAGDVTAAIDGGDPLKINLTQDTLGPTGNFVGGNGNIQVAPLRGFPALIVNFAGGAFGGPVITGNLSPIALTLRELSVYNGDNILVVEDSQSVSVGNFNVLNRPETFQYNYQYPPATITPFGQAAAPLNDFKGEVGYKFIGLRDQPIVTPNAQVFVQVEGFIESIITAAGGYPADTPSPKIPPISFTMNLVVDLLEDSIFGDPLVPSPASRAAANIKLGKQRVGQNKIIITNAVSRKPTL
jgi:hypothetical protein